MDALEEQQQELEVLESIYPDELTVVSATNFTIKITLDTVSDRKHRLLLHVTYPPTYPDVVPGLSIEIPVLDDDEDDEEEDDDDGDEKVVHLSEEIYFDRDDTKVLLEKLNEEAEVNIGMPSVFALTTQLKDEAEALFQQKLDREQRKHDDEMKKREVEEQKKFNGTKVTKESWAAWRDQFRAEMRIEEHDIERMRKMHNGKLTGKEIFEQGLAGDEDLLELLEEVKKVAV